MNLRIPRAGSLAAVALLLLGVGLAVARAGLLTEVAGVRLSAEWVMADFFSGVYYPVRAFLSGSNPHDRDWFLATYPVTDGYPPYLPINLLIHLPLGALPASAAAMAYFVVNVALTIGLSYLSLRLAGLPVGHAGVLLLAGAILVTRPGHWNLILGQRAAELAVASYGALYFAGRAPRLSAVALAVSLIKPTYGLPLALLMFARGYRQAVVLGLTAGAAVNLPLIILLASREGGVRPFVTTMLTGYHAWQRVEDVNPASSNVRIDAASTVSRLLGHPLPDSAQIAITLLILFVAAIVLRRRFWNDGSRPSHVDLGIICLAVLLTGHHVGYDWLLLTAPCVALLLRPVPELLSRWPARWFLAALFVVPALNWASTQAVLDAWQPSPSMWLAITSANGVCVAILFLTYLWYGVHVEPIPAGARSTKPSPAEPLP